MHACFGVHQGSEMWTEMTSIAPYLSFGKLIGFNIKNLELYIKQDSFNKLKGVIYGVAFTSRCNRNSVLSKSVKIFKISNKQIF